MDKTFSKTYSCPICALKVWLIEQLIIMGILKSADKVYVETNNLLPPKTDGFFKQLADELKVRGIARPDWNFFLDMKQGVVVDQQKVAALPIGAELPGYFFSTDICPECGCVYATQLKRVEGKKTLQPIPPMLNREDRRRLQRGGMNNPILS